ncbi:MAG TPA: MBL fold metallo-hydrolase [Gammaproteobacteria bacterium]|jgi:glyoxylase-like metal-dependent hydrolase (beta-lactamase superfamily II)|nr:MBL fold metallo-hydrolase [Gammaproteobacteria bacterium]
MLSEIESEGHHMVQIKSFFHQGSSTFSYLVSDTDTHHAALIDPVLDFDAAAGRTGTASAAAVVAYIRGAGLTLDWILETHAHADHLSAAQHIKQELGGRIAIGEGIRQVQQVFAKLFDVEAEVPADGSQFDHLFKDGETFQIGSLEVRVMATPGHTSDSLAYAIDDAVFTGDTLFMPDSGTARCDFPGGDAGMLYDSIQRMLALPPTTRMFLCHDYAPGGREYKNETTVADQKRDNIHVHDGISREEFIKLRTTRDGTLKVPALLLPAVQVNIRAGALPEPETNGMSYLKIPLNRF